MNSDFVIPETPQIKDIVTSFWEVSRDRELRIQETIIPKGMVEMIFVFNSLPFSVEINETGHSTPRCFIQGYHTSPLHILQTDTHTLFGVILSPSAIKHLFTCHPCEFANLIVDMTLIDSSFDSLWHRLGEQGSFSERVNVFTQWLSNRLPLLSSREKAFDSFLQSQLQAHITVDFLADHFCYSTKQLTRKLHELTGMNAERTLLYKKYLRAVTLIHTTNHSLTEIAHLCHFYDQAHFARTFKSLCNITAREYVQKKSWLEGHILEIVS